MFWGFAAALAHCRCDDIIKMFLCAYHNDDMQKQTTATPTFRREIRIAACFSPANPHNFPTIEIRHFEAQK